MLVLLVTVLLSPSTPAELRLLLACSLLLLLLLLPLPRHWIV